MLDRRNFLKEAAIDCLSISALSQVAFAADTKSAVAAETKEEQIIKAQIESVLQLEVQRNVKGQIVKQTIKDIAGTKPLEEIGKSEPGKIIFVDFWGDWCDPCKQDAKNVYATFEKLKQSNFSLDGVQIGKEMILVKIETDNQSVRQGAPFVSKGSPDLNHKDTYTFNAHGFKKITDTFGTNSYPRYLILDGYGRPIFEESIAFKIEEGLNKLRR